MKLSHIFGRKPEHESEPQSEPDLRHYDAPEDFDVGEAPEPALPAVTDLFGTPEPDALTPFEPEPPADEPERIYILDSYGVATADALVVLPVGQEAVLHPDDLAVIDKYTVPTLQQPSQEGCGYPPELGYVCCEAEVPARPTEADFADLPILPDLFLEPVSVPVELAEPPALPEAPVEEPRAAVEPYDPAEVRSWAQGQGIEVGGRGRLRKDVLEAFLQGNPARALELRTVFGVAGDEEDPVAVLVRRMNIRNHPKK
jgi:hypothetical protein